MKSVEFAYWLQGFFEIRRAASPDAACTGLTAEQANIIEKHLALVFKHEIDPSYPAEQQAELDAIHSGPAETPSKPKVPAAPFVPSHSGRPPVYRC